MRRSIDEQTPSQTPRPQDMARLIRKLRWIGMEEEADRLQTAACSLPADERGTVLAGPFSTD